MQNSTHIKLLLLLLSSFTFIKFSHAQISNGSINYELRADQYFQACDNDGFNNDDNEVRVGLVSDGNSGGSTSWNTFGPSCSGSNSVYTWDADAPSYSSGSLNLLLYTGLNRTGTAAYNINFESWEEDGSYDCSSSGDACVTTAASLSVTWNSVTRTAANWWSVGALVFAGGGWIRNNNASTGANNGDVKLKTAWRYTYGYNCSNPLDFGTITVGAAAKTHINTNRGVPSGGSANVGYANAAGNTAPDVYYTFTITTDATVIISTNNATTNYDSYLRLYNADCSNQLAFNDDFSGLKAEITQYLCAGTYKVLVEGTGGTPTGDFQLSISANSTTPAVPTTPTAGTFGANQWYVYGYNGGNLDLTGSVYKGYYIETALSYNTTSKWDPNFSPSYAPGWNGNCVNLDNHVVVSKRQGFPCKIYQLNIPSHDNDVRVYINGAVTPTWSHEPGCCDAHTNIWTGYLTSSSTIEVRHIDISSGSNQELTFTDVTPTLNGGTIAGITNNLNVCQGTDPGAFTSSVNAYGGTIGIVNGSPAAHVYLWQRATDAGFTTGLTGVGTNSNVYDIDNSLSGGTYYFRRRVTDACGNIAYSNTIQINVIYSLTTPTANAATAGSCTQWRANWNAMTGATGYRLDVATDNVFSNMVINNLNVGNVTSYDLDLPLGTYYYRVRAVNACFTSPNSGTISFTLANVANNDAYRNAIDITANVAGGGTYYGSFNNSSYGLEGSEPTPRDVYATAWYKFTTPAGGFTSLNAYVVTGDNSVVTIYRSNGGTCPFGNLTNLGDDYECAGSSGVSVTTNCLPGNTTYYMQFGSTDCFADGATKGNFSITITPGSVASPDDICNAITLGGATLDPGESVNNTIVNNTCATRQSGEPQGDVYNTVWYKFLTPSTGLVSVDFHLGENGGGSDNPAIVAYKSTGGCTFGSLTKVGEDIPGLGTDANSDFTVNCLDANTTYYIQCGYNDRTLDGGSAGVFDLDISASSNVAAPDNICSAIRVGTSDIGVNQSATTATYTNLCSTVNTGGYSDPVNADGNEGSDWFYFTTPATPAAQYYLSFNNIADFGTFGGLEGEVYKKTGGTCPPTLTYVGSWDPDACGVTEESGAFCLDPSSTYYVMVDPEQNGVCGGRGKYQLNVRGINAVKGADLCSGALASSAYDLGTLNPGATIGNASGSSRWNNFCATATGDPNPGWGTGSPNQPVWFRFTTAANAGRDVDFEAYNDPASLGDQINLRLALYEGCGGAKIFAEGTQPIYSESVNTKCLKPSTTYFVMVDGVDLIGGGEGYFGLTVKDNGPYPANDLVCGATSIPIQTQYTYNNAFLNNQDNTRGTNCFEPNPDWTFETGQDNDHGVWYYIGQIPGRTMVVDANNLSGDDIDIQMALYSSVLPKGSCVTPMSTPALTEVQKEYAGAGVVWDEDAYFNCLNPNLYYWLMIDGSAGATSLITSLEEGTFSLRTWFPEEGEITACAAENLGTIPIGNSITIKNLSNLCGVSSIAGFPEPSSFGFDNAVIYKFTTPGAPGFTDASIKIEATTNPYYDQATYSGAGGGTGGNMGTFAGDDVDLQLAVYSTGACNAVHYVEGSNYDPTNIDVTSGGSDESLIVNCLLPNTEYYLIVDGGPLNKSGYFDLKLSDYGKHTTNDFLCNAIDITATNSAPWTNCNSSTVVQLNGQNNYCATTNNDIPASLGLRPTEWSEINAPVWYKFKAPKSGKLKIEAINTFADALPPYDEPEISAQLAVFFLPGGYRGNCTNLSSEKDRLQYVGSNHDGLLHDEEYTIECLMADSIYYLLVDGSSETLCPGCDRGEFYLKLTADPRDRSAQNDLICDAVDLGTPAVWTTPTIYDTRVSPASGAGTYTSPTTGYPTTTGLHNGARNNGNTCMRVENNYCAGIDNEPAVNGGNFLTDFSPDGTVWYKFIAPTTGEVKINTMSDPDSRGDLIYTQIAVFETSDNTCTGTMIGIAADGIPSNVNGDNELIVKCLDPGKTYFLMIDGAGVNKRGYFELQIQAVPATLTGPPNDDICSATALTYPASIGAVTTVNNQTNRCATIQNIYSEPTTFTKDADVWYKFTTPNTVAPHAVEVTVTSGLPWPFGDAMDPQIALYKMNPTGGPCATSFTLVDDGYSALGLPFYESFEFHCLEQNTTYYLMVDGSGINEQGNFKLDIKRIAPHPLAGNDNICAVTNIATGLLGTLGGTTGNKVGNTTTNWHNFCSDVEAGEAALMSDGNYTLDQTVWFKFRTPNTANNIDVEIRALNDPNNVGDQIDLQMLLVQGNPGCSPTNFTSLTPIESVDPLLTFNATMNVCLPPNTDFYINVDGSGLNKQGYFTIEVENNGLTSAPSNDNICSAKILPSGGTITGAYTGYLNDNNNCATLENFEKQQAPGSIQRSVWYKFVAPVSADVSVQVKGNSAIPFTTNYFLPDVTIWELNEGTFASPATGISGCPNPAAVQWNKLEYNDYQGIPNSLANGFYPTVVLTPLCLKPGYTYYVQVDGSAGVGLDGYFDITIKNNQVSYSGPINNEASNATTVPISTASCQYSNGTWQSASGYSFGNNPTWSNPSLIGITTAGPLPSCTQNCGDVWYKFKMPAPCGNNTKSFVKIEGDDEFNLDLNGYPELVIAAYKGPSSGVTSNLTYLKCSIGGGDDPDFSIAADPGEWIYLQIWDLEGNEQNKTFKLCVSEQKSADDCQDATAMTLDVPYCWSVESHTGENPNSAVPGSGLNTCFGSGIPKHSSYFSFTTDGASDFCDDYYIYINTAALAKALPSGANNACISGTSASVQLNMTLWKVKAGGSLCTPGVANVSQEDCITFNDCGGGSFGANVVGPHGNGGLVDDTIYYNLTTGQELAPNTTYYIVLDYDILNPAYANRVILDGIIEVGRRCKGRTWEYTTNPTVSTNKYCTSRDGWRHYYDDKGTPSVTGDDKYVFSLFPNGNAIEGTATITLDNNFHRFEDFPNHFAEYVMRRRWDFQVSTGTIDPTKPVKVRFYYKNSEKQEIITEALNFAVMYPSNYEDFEWFKSANGHVFSPYTDVNPKVISVGPNGYSETGCLSYWNAAGVYVGPPGVQRCIQKTITDWDDNNAYHETCNGIHFAEYNGLTGFSGGTGGAGDSPYDVSPLPVELISFTGYNNGDINVLDWKTASEINTSKFIVERRNASSSSFNYIGEKPAAGNSSIVLEYSLIDESPAIGNNYYRLKMIDVDGSYEYSQTILISNKEAASYNDVIINIYPNPTNQTLYVDYQSANNSNIKLSVYDALGQSMFAKKMNVIRGNQQIKLDVNSFAIGVYILHILDENSGKILQTKFVKE